MTNPRNAVGAGYKVERIYVAEQHYELVDPASVPSAAPGDRTISLGWDWRPIGPRRFEVMLEVDVAPDQETPDHAQVRLAGVFEAEQGRLSVPFATFIRENAVAILFPYAREVVSTMTGRGPHGSFHLNPINVVALLAEARISDTSGAKLLAQNPERAADFGLSLELPAPSPPSLVADVPLKP